LENDYKGMKEVFYIILGCAIGFVVCVIALALRMVIMTGTGILLWKLFLG